MIDPTYGAYSDDSLPSESVRPWLAAATLTFLLTFALLFLLISNRPNFYDGSLVLVAGMRVLAGQLPHRDFYANYGPAQFYILAALFKTFGPSVFVSRLYDLLLKSLLVASIFTLVSGYARRSIVAGTCIVVILWLFALNSLSGTSVIPVSLLNIWAAAALLPVFTRPVSRRRMVLTGALAGCSTLFRYDTGLALLASEACLLAAASFLNNAGASARLRAFVANFWPILLAFSLVLLFPVFYFLRHAPFSDFFFDIVLYPAKYYHRGRNLPFFVPHLGSLDAIEDYLPILVVIAALFAVVTRWPAMGIWARQRQAFIILFTLLTSVMYLKGLVRISPVQLYLCIMPCVVLTAALFEWSFSFSALQRRTVFALVGFTVIAPAFAARREVKNFRKNHDFLVTQLLPGSHASEPAEIAAWCGLDSPLTRGMCFLPEDGRIQTIEFLREHTTPVQTLYVGQTRHDRIYANDNLLYVGSGRLPATKWSHFDPDLQNSLPIQQEMVAELENNRPPYVVLDSELDGADEPNDSSKSSGVFLLDQYLQIHYVPVAHFGVMTVMQRTSTP